MTLLQTINLAHIPATHPVYITLFKDVQNAPFLQQQLLDCNTDFEYAFVDASTILSTTHILAAVFRALNDLLNNRLRSRNVHSEIVYCLNPNNNIATSFRTFGIMPATTALLCIKVSTPDAPHSSAAVSQHLDSVIQGTALAFSDSSLHDVSSIPHIRKVYKLDAVDAGGKKGKKSKINGDSGGVDAKQTGESQSRKEMEAAILSIMALRGS